MKRELADVSYVVGSGMITSNLGLMEIKHLIAPADYTKFAKNLKPIEFSWLEGTPFYLIPGMKNDSIEEVEFLSDIDVMCGEEVEIIDVLDKIGTGKKMLVILPDSHTKFIYVDENGKMLRCSTTMLGELLSVLAKHTILKSALPDELIKSIDTEFVKRRGSYQESFGLSRAFFVTRFLEIQIGTSANQRVNFLGGAIVSDDVTTNAPAIGALKIIDKFLSESE